MIADVMVEWQGFRMACAFDDEGELAVTPESGLTGNVAGEAKSAALHVEGEWAYYKLTTPEMPQGFVSAEDELVDWLRVNYGDGAVTFKTVEAEKGRVY